MRQLFLYFVAMIAILSFVACKGRSSGNDQAGEAVETELIDEDAALTGEDLTFRQRKKNLVEEVLEKQLDSLANGLWNPAEYKRLSDWIDGDELDLRYSARTSFRSLLDADYCISMDNEARIIMGSSSCGKSHSRLDQIMAERKKFDEGRTSIGKSVRTAYSHHEEMKRIVSSFSTKQSVNSFKDKYDESFESKKREEAKAVLKKYPNPVCSYLQALKSPVFTSRRKDFCDKILALYEQFVHQNGQVVNSEKNAVEGTLLNTYGTYGKNKNAEAAAMADWRKRLDNLATSTAPEPVNE